jgi:hypothetical protein
VKKIETDRIDWNRLKSRDYNIFRKLRETRSTIKGVEKKANSDYESLALPLNYASIYIYLQ